MRWNFSGRTVRPHRKLAVISGLEKTVTDLVDDEARECARQGPIATATTERNWSICEKLFGERLGRH